MGERMRGRKGQEALKRRRAMHPFCAHCEARGIVRPAVEIDHVVPLALGGEDVDDNTQGLCLPCHAIKTALEDASAGGASNHPDWLRPAKCRLTIVSGPPCSGKSTLVAELAEPRDMVIDLDELADKIRPGFLASRQWDAELLNRAIRARNSLLGSLATLPPRSQAWFIVSAPTRDERDWWDAKLKPATWRHLDPGQDVCAARAWRRGDRNAASAIAAWYVRRGDRWQLERPRAKRQAFGEDGYPVE